MNQAPDILSRLDKSHHYSEGNFAFYVLDEPEAGLNEIAMAGYLLHGTPRKLAILKPHQANDSAKQSGNRLAIYMTKSPAIAMFSALSADVPGTSQHHVNSSVINGKLAYSYLHFVLEDPKKLADSGYVYIFGNDQIDEVIENEYLSFSPRKPLAVVQIRRDDFSYPVETL